MCDSCSACCNLCFGVIGAVGVVWIHRVLWSQLRAGLCVRLVDPQWVRRTCCRPSLLAKVYISDGAISRCRTCFIRALPRMEDVLTSALDHSASGASTAVPSTVATCASSMGSELKLMFLRDSASMLDSITHAVGRLYPQLLLCTNAT